jgi:hypothetical protein
MYSGVHMYGHNKASFGEIWRDLAGFRRLVLLSAGGLAFVVWENEERVTWDVPCTFSD